MAPRTGRPKAENPKSNDLKVRIDDRTLQQLDDYCETHGIPRSQAIRQGILLLLAQEK